MVSSVAAETGMSSALAGAPSRSAFDLTCQDSGGARPTFEPSSVCKLRPAGDRLQVHAEHRCDLSGVSSGSESFASTVIATSLAGGRGGKQPFCPICASSAIRALLPNGVRRVLFALTTDAGFPGLRVRVRFRSASVARREILKHHVMEIARQRRFRDSPGEGSSHGARPSKGQTDQGLAS